MTKQCQHKGTVLDIGLGGDNKTEPPHFFYLVVVDSGITDCFLNATFSTGHLANVQNE